MGRQFFFEDAIHRSGPKAKTENTMEWICFGLLVIFALAAILSALDRRKSTVYRILALVGGLGIIGLVGLLVLVALLR
jgi:hypothetical protein